MTGMSSRPRGAAVIFAICSVFLVTSCAELDARRKIQKGDKLYAEGKYAEAITLYEKALDESNLATGHHNLAVAAYVAFEPGIDTEANAAYAAKASKHFQEYLKHKPNDVEIIKLMTTVWLDSDQIDVALSYWEERRAAQPNEVGPIRKLGEIQRQAGNYDEALKWDYKRVEMAKSPEAKALALSQIGQLQYSRLSKSDMIDAERLAVADSGLAAFQDALKIQPDNPKHHSMMATIYQFRALAHQTQWAQLADTASQRYHHLRRKELTDAAKAKTETQTPSKASGTPAPESAGKDKE